MATKKSWRGSYQRLCRLTEGCLATYDQKGCETNRFPLVDIVSTELSGATLIMRMQPGCGCFPCSLTLTLSDERAASRLQTQLTGGQAPAGQPPDPELLFQAVNQVVEELERAGSAAPATAARVAALEEVEQLLQGGVNVNACGFSGETIQPAPLAVATADVELMRMLLAHGASVDAGLPTPLYVSV